MRAILCVCLGMAFASYALPQERAAASESKHETEQGDQWIWWKWANFAMLAGGLGYLVRKHAPGFFQKRSAEIQQAISEAAAAKREAEARAAQIELRLAGVQSEIDKLRTTSRTEMAAEGERIGQETERHLKNIQRQAEQQIALMTRTAREELRKYSASLALDLAGQRIRARMTADTQDYLVDGFVHDLHHGVRRGATAQ